MVKNSSATAGDAGDVGLIPGQKGPLEKERNPKVTPVLLPGTSHGQKSPEGYSPWGHTELGTTERLSTHSSQKYPHKIQQMEKHDEMEATLPRGSSLLCHL